MFTSSKPVYSNQTTAGPGWVWRKGFYAVLTIALVALAAFGVISADQGERLLTELSPLIGAIGTGAAFAFTHRGSDDRTTADDLVHVAEAAAVGSSVSTGVEDMLSQLLDRVEVLSSSLLNDAEDTIGKHYAEESDASAVYPGGGEVYPGGGE